MEKNNSALFYSCSLIEYIGRRTKNKRKDIVDVLGNKVIKKIYQYSDVFHCEPIEKVANDFIEEYKIKDGGFDNVGKCKYEVPDYWAIGAVFERLIEDSFQDEEKAAEGIWEVYHSWTGAHTALHS